jgi:hypothetical protein
MIFFGKPVPTFPDHALKYAKSPVRQITEAEERLGRLYSAIEVATIDGADPT